MTESRRESVTNSGRDGVAASGRDIAVVIAPSEHAHEWEPVGLKHTTRRIYDGITNPVVPVTLAIRSCKCGAIRRTEV